MHTLTAVSLSVTKTVYKISDFLAWQKAGLLILNPAFQRRAVWKPGAKSYLLDTIIRGLPIPIILLREQKTDLSRLEHRREVVDGQQRIRTVLSFIEPALLPDYQTERDAFLIKKTHNEELANKGFRELPTEIQQDVLDYQFSVHILPSSIDDREIKQIFVRLNSTGYRLNDQELRNAAFFGELKTSMFELAAEQLTRWHDWGVFSEDQISRMLDVELASEFALLMLRGIVGKSKASLDRVYKDNDDAFPDRREIERRFRECMDAIDRVIGSKLRSTIFRKRVPFFALFALFYHALFGIQSDLRRTRSKPLPAGLAAGLLKTSELMEAKKASQKVLEAMSRRTTHPESRRTVIQYLTEVSGAA